MNYNKRFEKYHRDNPHLYDLFVKYARDAKRAGFKNYGMHTIMHRVRWHVDVETRDPAGFKINNNYSSRYARLIMDNNPDLQGFFRLRELRT